MSLVQTLKFDDVVGVILSKEMRRKITGETSGNALSMESRASCHATPHRKLFHDYVQGDFGHVFHGG